MASYPAWHDWPIEISPHAARRMPARGFSEVDIRSMIESPIEIVRDTCPGRYLARCLWHGRRWDVILEPDDVSNTVIIVTAYAPELL